MRDDEIALGMRHASVWSTAANEFGADWLHQQGRPMFGISSRGMAVAQIGPLTISESSEGGFEWYIETLERTTHGHIDSQGRTRVKSRRPGEPS